MDNQIDLQQQPQGNEKLNQILENMNSMLCSVKNELSSVNHRLESLTSEVQGIRAQQASLQQNVNEVSQEVAGLKDKMCEIDILKNQFEQEALRNDVSIVGVPSTYEHHVDEFIDSFNRACEITLSSNSFKFVHFINNKKLDRCNVRLRFLNHSKKVEFMSRINSLSKDSNGRRQPLVVEDIFTEHQENPSTLTGKQMFVLNALTPANRDMLKLKHRYKPQINFMWEQEGRILMKHNSSSRVVQAMSPWHVHNFANQSPNITQNQNFSQSQNINQNRN